MGHSDPHVPQVRANQEAWLSPAPAKLRIELAPPQQRAVVARPTKMPERWVATEVAAVVLEVAVMALVGDQPAAAEKEAEEAAVEEEVGDLVGTRKDRPRLPLCTCCLLPGSVSRQGAPSTGPQSSVWRNPTRVRPCTTCSHRCCF